MIYIDTYIHSGILFSLKKEGNPIICNNMEAIMLSEIIQTNTAWYHLYVESKIIIIIN